MACVMTLVLLAAACSPQETAPPVAATAPAQHWERLRTALFVRTGPDGNEYGADELDPLLFPHSSYLLREPRLGESAAALDELLADTSSCALLEPLQRALWQRALWFVYDWLVEQRHAASEAHPGSLLEQRLARLLRRLALDASELQALRGPPDGAGGTPRGLFTAEQGWVRLGDARDRPVTPAHMFHFGGRSHFEVLLRLPAGREETIAYLARLRGVTEPFVVQSDAPHFRADLPQFPAGTAVALVRRPLLFDADGQLVVTPLVERVQLRTYLAIGMPAGPNPYSPDLSTLQQLAEFHLRRSRLLAGEEGGLAQVAPGDPDFTSFSTHGCDPFEDPNGLDPWIARALERCGNCHGQPGIYAVNSFTRVSGGAGTIFTGIPSDEPTVAIEGDAREQAEATLAFARERASWKALKEAWRSTPR